jgi:endonuclease YncB( thermonuclease family)
MSRKRRSPEEQVALETERLDDALDELVGQLGLVLPMAEEQPQIAVLQAKVRREAALALAAVSERKARLLGLDAPEQKKPAGAEAEGSLAALERKLALVSRSS